MARIDESRAFVPVGIAVLTVSDTRTLQTDTSGDALVERIATAGHQVRARDIVVDDAASIEAILRRWIATPDIDVVITTGGTGITGRDVTPEAFDRVLDKRIDGFGELFRMLSFQEDRHLHHAVPRAGGGRRRHLPVCAAGQHGRGKDAWDDILVWQLDARHRPCNLVELMPRLREHLG